MPDWGRALVLAFLFGVGGGMALDILGLDGPPEAKIIFSMGMGLLGAALAMTRGN
ncbi:hypothetical protein ACI6QG_00895 [Roseococcus sp. DSY-14]|uniref:hypothetical protein n=1 Tax=Roseococcus sp. DSY-14 TaxID=3369650 RepID=UPI00387B314E